MGTNPPLGFNWPTAIKVGAAVVSGIGLLGFVTIVGAFVMWIPLYHARVPTDFALAAKSRTELLTVGGGRLIVFALLAVALVLIFFFLHKVGDPWPWWADVLPGVVLVLAALGLTYFFFQFDWRNFPGGWTNPKFWILAGVAVVGVFMAYLVAAVFGSFGWFAFTLAAAIALFSSVLAIARTWDTPKIQSFALLRKGDDLGIRGFYIAETKDFVHVAQGRMKCKKGVVVEGPTHVRIVVVPRSEIVALAIGPKLKLCTAWAHADKLRFALRAQRDDQSLRWPSEAQPLADGALSVPVKNVVPPNRLMIEDVDLVPEQDSGTAGPVRLAVRIATEEPKRPFVVAGARVFVTAFPSGLFKPISPKKKLLTDRRGLARLTLEPVKQRNSTVPSRLVLHVRAVDPKPKRMAVSSRRLMRVRLGADRER